MTDNPREAIGANNPPTPFDEARDEINGLYDEAKNWLDGAGVTTDADAEGIAKLLDMLRKAEKRADDLRKEEKKPHDEAAKEVQTKWKPLLDRASLAVDVCKKAIEPFLARKEQEQRTEARRLQQEAEAAADAAREAFVKTDVTDLAGREFAENQATLAKDIEKAARKAGNAKASVKGGARAVALRTYYRAELTDANAFAKWVWQFRREELTEFLSGLAQKLTDAKHPDIPGVTVHEEKRAA